MSSITVNVVTVGASGSLLHQADGDGNSVAVKNESAVTIYVGPSDVSVASGFPVEAGAVLSVDLPPAVSLFAKAETEGNEVRVLVADR
jgi:hypothetical protein